PGRRQSLADLRTHGWMQYLKGEQGPAVGAVVVATLAVVGMPAVFVRARAVAEIRASVAAAHTPALARCAFVAAQATSFVARTGPAISATALVALAKVREKLVVAVPPRIVAVAAAVGRLEHYLRSAV